MKTLKFLILAALVVSLGVLAAGCTGEKPIGGEKDEHGCLTGAGYSWWRGEGEVPEGLEEPCTSTSAIDTFEECVRRLPGDGELPAPVRVTEDPRSPR